ncbi:receptor-like kinase TMK4 [Wolffia australiana]
MAMRSENWKKELKFLQFFHLLAAILCRISSVSGETDPGDFAVLEAFHKGLENAELLKWPIAGEDEDPCGSRWPHVFCSGNRVTQIQVAKLGLIGPLPHNLNELAMLDNVGLQMNNFSGPLPSFRGLSRLRYAYLGSNRFESVPSDFFQGLDSLQVLSLEYNPLNQSSGWALPADLAGSAQLFNLSLSGCHLAGEIPDFLAGMASLTHLKLSYNNLSGEVPAGFSELGLQTLWLNNQAGESLTGPITFLSSMASLTDVWLHGNKFTGTIPPSIASATSIQRLWIDDNLLVGTLPESFAAMPQLRSLRVGNNRLVGSIPKLSVEEFSFSGNSFCDLTPGSPCSSQVNALLGFLGGVNFPLDLSEFWSGDDPCSGPWPGVSCLGKNVSAINLQNRRLNGVISDSIGRLASLTEVRLNGNNLSGAIPLSLTSLTSLRLLNLSENNLAPPIPKFHVGVKLLLDGNPLLDGSPPRRPIPDSPPRTSNQSKHAGDGTSTDPSSSTQSSSSSSSSSSGYEIAIAAVVVAVTATALAAIFVLLRRRRKNRRFPESGELVIDSEMDASGKEEEEIKMASGLESGDLLISVEAMRRVTGGFAPANELGRGGFGVVYKGVFHDGSAVAVKRMEAAVVSRKAMDEFQSEISVLSKVRHKNLVSLLGYSVQEGERLLVYEFMPKGALSRHLFEWKKLGLEPLPWTRRLAIALDVARGMEYLHGLAHQSFIHRDLKSSNILLDDDFRAKVSDFGLVKLAPDGQHSVVTRLAGTFGYLAPEYAVAGKVTTKADVFSFGVVLMELVTGLAALDEARPEESQHLAAWFVALGPSKDKLRAAVDPAMVLTEDAFESVSVVAELARHCATRDPRQRPDMGHAVNVLGPLVDRWRPADPGSEDCAGIDFSQPLLQMVKGWQADDFSGVNSAALDDSQSSIPARPAGFADSFTSADGR